MQKITSLSTDQNKSLISIAIFIIALALGYYFVFYLPKSNEQKLAFSMQEKCREVGEQAYKADLKQYNASNLNSPQYSYNKKLRTCIYASGYNDQGSPSAGRSKEGFLPHNCDANWENWVKDSYTNKEIISVFNMNGSDCEWITPLEEIQKFNDEKEKLLNNQN